MGLDSLTVTLSSYEKLEILRAELRTLEEELEKTERDLRTALRAMATHKFLKSVAPFYNERPLPQAASAAPELERRRQSLYQVIQTVRATIPRLEATATGAQGAGPSRAEGRRNRFEP